MQQYSDDLRRKLIRAWQDWDGSEQELADWGPYGPETQMLPHSGCRAEIVVQHPAPALAPLDHTCVSEVAWFGAEKPIRPALLVTLGVIMRHDVNVFLSVDSSHSVSCWQSIQ
jgi:hypothetical protein